MGVSIIGGFTVFGMCVYVGWFMKLRVVHCW